MKNSEKIFKTEWLGRTLAFKVGKVAKQAHSAVITQYGDTVVLATVVESKEAREGIDFFPLMVDFEERLYAAGIIKGSRWVKREGRPSDEAVLTGRMVDRSIRPLFKEDSRKDVQVILTLLSADKENDHDIVALVAASAALYISGVDWMGPIGGIRVGRIGGKFVFNPTYNDRENSDLDLIVSGTKQKTIMIECGANEIKEEEMLKAILAGQKELQKPIELIEKMKQDISPIKKEITQELKDKEELKAEKEKEKAVQEAEKWLNKNTTKILFNKNYYTKGERKLAIEEIKKELNKYLFDKEFEKDLRKYAINSLVEKTVEREVSMAILEKKQRVDGRKLDELRDISAEVEILPRNHGAGLFSRGETQVLSILTLAGPGMQQMLEGVEGQSFKRYIHHYNFPPFSVGEARPARSAGRREIGHGALAEKALIPVLPEEKKFPYTIRVVSETLGSNGSSSMASTCASSLALMDAGVPIKKAVAGIAMGLASNEDMSRWEVLTDIQDLEDGKGGMDFKITRTIDGITAIQLDTKTYGLTEEIIKKTLLQGKKALLQLLEIMNKAIKAPKTSLSPYAPRIITLNINPEKIGSVIGPGGKTINKIIEETETTIDIDNDGTVVICGIDKEKSQIAAKHIHDLTREVEVGETFKGKVIKILDFGAFVELLPGRDGMVHVSEIAPFRVDKPGDLLNIGDEVTVKVKNIDEQGRVNLTMKIFEENKKYWNNQPSRNQPKYNPHNRQNRTR